MKWRSLAFPVLAGILIALAGAWFAVLHQVTIMLDWDDADWVFERIG